MTEREPFVSGLPGGPMDARARAAAPSYPRLVALRAWAKRDADAVRPYTIERFDGAERLPVDELMVDALAQYEAVIRIVDGALRDPVLARRLERVAADAPA